MDSQDDPFGELEDENDSFDEDTSTNTDKTSGHLASDEIIDSEIQIDDIKCEPDDMKCVTPTQRSLDSLKWRSALINRQFGPHKHKRNMVWARNCNKLARQSGLAHVTYRNVPVPAKMPNLSGPLCYEKCRQKCSEKLSMEQREAIFSAYYSLDNNGKNFVISSCLHRKDVRFHRKNTQKQKLHSFHYFINVPEHIEPIRLCKKAICSLFQVSASRIENIQQKFLAGELSDRRGKHSRHRNQKPARVLNEMQMHFGSLETENHASHDDVAQNGNSKKKRNRSSSKLIIKQMYEHYIEQCTSKGLSDEYFVSYAFYVKYFSKKRAQPQSQS